MLHTRIMGLARTETHRGHRHAEPADGWSVQIGSVRTRGSPSGGEKRGNNRDALGTFGCFPICGRTAVTTAI